jgi:hypothetical protein
MTSNGVTRGVWGGLRGRRGARCAKKKVLKPGWLVFLRSIPIVIIGRPLVAFAVPALGVLCKEESHCA